MKKEKTRNIHLEISAIADAAGFHLCDALPGLHAFTGCYSTSVFAGKGKKTALKLSKIDLQTVSIKLVPRISLFPFPRNRKERRETLGTMLG